MSKHKSGKRLTKQRLVEMLPVSAESERDIFVETSIQGAKAFDASGKDAGCRRNGRNGVG